MPPETTPLDDIHLLAGQLRPEAQAQAAGELLSLAGISRESISAFLAALGADDTDELLLHLESILAVVRTCRVCGCTDDSCAGCMEATGQPCHWVEDDLCSACQALLETTHT